MSELQIGSPRNHGSILCRGEILVLLQYLKTGSGVLVMKLTSFLHLLPKLRINERYAFIMCAGKPPEKSSEI